MFFGNYFLLAKVPAELIQSLVERIAVGGPRRTHHLHFLKQLVVVHGRPVSRNQVPPLANPPAQPH